MPKKSKKVQAVTEQQVRLVAAFAGADVRTVRKFLEGGIVRGAALRERLERAVKQADAAKDIEPNSAGVR